MAETSPDCMVGSAPSSACRTAPTAIVGHEPPLLSVRADTQQASRVRTCTLLLQAAERRYERTGCFADCGEADRYRLELEQLTGATPA
jgi:hypothetical protein